jgi:hypothetical protein
MTVPPVGDVAEMLTADCLCNGESQISLREVRILLSLSRGKGKGQVVPVLN